MRTFDTVIANEVSKLTSVRNLPRDDDKASLALRHFRGDTTPASKSSIVLQHWSGFLFVTSQGTVNVALCPVVIGDNLYASAHDNLQQASPLKFKPTIQTAGPITLCDAASASTHGYKHLAEDVCSVPDATAPNEQKPDIPDFIDVTPVFTYLPIIFPITAGLQYPTDIDLNAPLPTETMDWPPQLVDWLKGMHFLFNSNDSKSLSHVHSQSFFAVGTVKNTDFPNCGHSSTCIPSFSSLDPFHSDYRLYMSEWRSFQEALALKSMDLAATSGELPAGSPAALDPTALAAALAAANKETTTKSERDTAQLAATVTNYWRVFLSSVVTDADGSTEVHPAILSDNFTQLLQVSSIKDALELLHRTFPLAYPVSPDSHDIFDAALEWDIELMGHAFVAAIRGFKWGNRNLNQHPSDADTKLTLLAFIPPDRTCVTYRETVHHNETVKCQEALDEAKSKVTTKKTTITLGTSITHTRHFLSTVANLKQFCKFACRDPHHKPFLIFLMEQYLAALRKPNAKDWITQHATQHHIPILMVLEMNAILEYLATTASNPSVQSLFSSGNPIPPDHFRFGKDILDEALKRLNLAVHFGNLGTFNTHCAMLSKLLPHLQPPPTIAQRKHQHQGTPKRDRPTASNPPSTDKRPKASRSNLGVFNWQGPGDPPKCAVKLWHTHRKEQRPICMDFACRGRECNRQTKNCWNIHLTEPLRKNLNADDTKELTQWVAKTQGLTFATPPTNGQ